MLGAVDAFLAEHLGAGGAGEAGAAAEDGRAQAALAGLWDAALGPLARDYAEGLESRGSQRRRAPSPALALGLGALRIAAGERHRRTAYDGLARALASVQYFAPGVDNTEFHNSLIVGRLHAGVLTPNG